MNKGRMYKTLLDCLTREGYEVIELRDTPTIIVKVSACAGPLTFFCHVDEDEGQVSFRGRYDVTVPGWRLRAVCDLVHHINRQCVGKFVVDFDGAIFYETFTEVDDELVTPRLFRRLFLRSIRIADDYLPCFRAMIGQTDADEDDGLLDYGLLDQQGIHRVDDVLEEANTLLDY